MGRWKNIEIICGKFVGRPGREILFFGNFFLGGWLGASAPLVFVACVVSPTPPQRYIHVYTAPDRRPWQFRQPATTLRDRDCRCRSRTASDGVPTSTLWRHAQLSGHVRGAERAADFFARGKEVKAGGAVWAGGPLGQPQDHGLCEVFRSCSSV